MVFSYMNDGTGINKCTLICFLFSYLRDIIPDSFVDFLQFEVVIFARALEDYICENDIGKTGI